MALGYLMILFVGVTVVSGLGLAFLYLTKNEQVKKILFYVLAVWGMLIAAYTAISLPTNWAGQQVLTWAIGFLSVIGIVVHVKANSPAKYLAARLLVTVSIILGIVRMFIW